MKNKNIIGTKTIVIEPYIIFILINVWLHKLLKKVQYGCHGKNGKVSDQTERT